jgi:glycerophosphoryl diester phosphodiesterase
MNLLHHIEKCVDFTVACWPRPKPLASIAKEVCLVAHRGAHDDKIQENTDKAFETALNLGCYGIEFDIHSTKDNVLVVNHDATLDRLWGVHRSIEALNFPELHTLVPSLPTLSQVVKKYGQKMHLFIELKTPILVPHILEETMKPLTPVKDYHFIALKEANLTPLIGTFPKASMLLVPVHNNVNEFMLRSLHEGYGGILSQYLLLSQNKIKQLHQAHQIAGVGFVDSKQSLYREMNRGLRYLFTNHVEKILLCLKDLAP